jgi:hypothetical protein
MALIRGSILADISGSINGITFQRSRGGLVARNRTTPINPRTALQESNRALFAGVSTLWASLNATQIAKWNDSAHAYPATNRLGETYYPSGRQFFMQCNRNLSLIGEQTTIEAPPPDSLPPLPLAAIALNSAAAAGFITTLTATIDTDGGADTALSVLMKTTPPMAIARAQSYRNLLRGPYTGGVNYIYPTGASANIKAAYEDRYSEGNDVIAATNQVINFAYRYVDKVFGLSSSWFYGNSVIA